MLIWSLIEIQNVEISLILVLFPNQYQNHCSMRILEITFLLSVIAFFISVFLKNSSIKKWILYSATLFLVLHLLIEESRWQMYLGYVSFVIGVLFYVRPRINRWIRGIGSGFGMLLSIVAFVLGVVMPVIEFPKPTGDYTVGVDTLYFEDQSRPELITEVNDDKRKLTVHIWYPSSKKITKPERYLDDGYAEVFAQSKGMPTFMASHFNLTKTHTQRLLPIIKNKRLPVVVLSHGLTWSAKMYTTLVEEMVSKGYMVVGIDHMYESFLTEYEGERIRWSEENIRKMNEGIDFKFVNETNELFKQEKDTTRKYELLSKVIHHLPYFESLDRWSNDISFVLDQIERLNNNPDSVFFQKFDVDNIGLMGHSWGGAAVVQNAAVDSRVKGVINLDGAQWGRAIDTTLKVPLLVMHADRNYKEFFTPNFYIYDRITREDYYLATIASSAHTNFGDLSYWTKINALTETGTIAPKRMSNVTNQLVLAFFDKHLQNKSIAFAKEFSSEQYPEIEMIKKK